MEIERIGNDSLLSGDCNSMEERTEEIYSIFLDTRIVIIYVYIYIYIYIGYHWKNGGFK